MSIAADLAVVVPSHRCPSPEPAADGDGLRRGPAVVACIWVMAWALTIGGEVTGLNRYFGHETALGGAAAPWVAAGLFLAGWLLMATAMMLPVAAPVIRQLRPPPGIPLRTVGTAFLGGFLVVWGAAGYLLLGLDLIVHRLVDRLPFLSARPWLVAATLLAVAGVAQLAPSTTRRLVAVGRAGVSDETERSAAATGRQHAKRCLRADGPLVLVMFGAGGQLGWMALLTAVMAAERSPRSGPRVARAVGVALLVGAVLVAHDTSRVLGPFDAFS